MISDYDCILFCMISSYRESRIFSELDQKTKQLYQNRLKLLLDKGWHALPTTEELNIGREFGYFAVAYYKLHNETKTVEIVIAHRGTCFDELGNVLADLAIAEGLQPLILKDAVFRYVSEVYCKGVHCNGEVYDVKKITHTGFSLGGFIAGACAGLSEYEITDAVTFDAPGIGNLKVDEKKVEKRIRNYVTVPNLINTCNVHIGEVRQLIIPAYELVSQKEHVEFSVAFTDLENPGNLKTPKNSNLGIINEINSTIRTHNLPDIRRYVESNTNWKYRTIYRWPVASNVIVYGEVPKIPKTMKHFGTSNGWEVFLSTIAIGVQISKFLGSSVIWKLTRRVNEAKKVVGVIGMHHKRSNRIFYTKQDFIKRNNLNDEIGMIKSC
jgi:hypothetical protein